MLKYVIGAVDVLNSVYVYFSFDQDLFIPHSRKCEATEFDEEEIEHAVKLVEKQSFRYLNVKVHLLL